MKIAEALAEHDILPGLGTTSRPCEGATFHSPTPLSTFEVWPGNVFDDSVEPRPGLIYMCGTCRENLRIFVSLSIASNGALPWELRREFGNRIRLLGQEIWTKHYEESRG